jgi:DNA-binding NtrC family response regulator
MENIITQGVLFSKGEEILPKDVGMETDRSGGCLVEKACQDLPYKKAKEETLHQFNSNYIGHRLTETRGNVTLAAKNCGLERQALQQIMRRYKIKADQFRKK